MSELVSVCMRVYACAHVCVCMCMHIYVHTYSVYVSPAHTQDIIAQQKQLTAVNTVAEQLIDRDSEHSEDIAERQDALADR